MRTSSIFASNAFKSMSRWPNLTGSISLIAPAERISWPPPIFDPEVPKNDAAFSRDRFNRAENRGWKPPVLDAAADLYGGDENNRSQVRSFIQMLRGIALRNDCAVILLSHRSVDAMKNDRGYSGSTAWNASVRSRLYFSSLPIQDGETDTDARILELKKSNRAQRGLKLCLRWRNGVFVPEGTGEDAARKMEIGILAETTFLQLLDERNSQKRHVSDRPGANYAPAIFAEHPATKGLSKDQLKHAMERLFTSGRIKVDTIGPSSRQVRQIVRVS